MINNGICDLGLGLSILVQDGLLSDRASVEMLACVTRCWSIANEKELRDQRRVELSTVQANLSD